MKRVVRFLRALNAFEQSRLGEALGAISLFVLLWVALWAGAVLS